MHDIDEIRKFATANRIIFVLFIPVAIVPYFFFDEPSLKVYVGYGFIGLCVFALFEYGIILWLRSKGMGHDAISIVLLGLAFGWAFLSGWIVGFGS